MMTLSLLLPSDAKAPGEATPVGTLSAPATPTTGAGDFLQLIGLAGKAVAALPADPKQPIAKGETPRDAVIAVPVGASQSGTQTPAATSPLANACVASLRLAMLAAPNVPRVKTNLKFAPPAISGEPKTARKQNARQDIPATGPKVSNLNSSIKTALPASPKSLPTPKTIAPAATLASIPQSSAPSAKPVRNVVSFQPPSWPHPSSSTPLPSPTPPVVTYTAAAIPILAMAAAAGADDNNIILADMGQRKNAPGLNSQNGSSTTSRPLAGLSANPPSTRAQTSPLNSVAVKQSATSLPQPVIVNTSPAPYAPVPLKSSPTHLASKESPVTSVANTSPAPEKETVSQNMVQTASPLKAVSANLSVPPAGDPPAENQAPPIKVQPVLAAGESAPNSLRPIAGQPVNNQAASNSTQPITEASVNNQVAANSARPATGLPAENQAPTHLAQPDATPSPQNQVVFNPAQSSGAPSANNQAAPNSLQPVVESSVDNQAVPNPNPGFQADNAAPPAPETRPTVATQLPQSPAPSNQPSPTAIPPSAESAAAPFLSQFLGTNAALVSEINLLPHDRNFNPLPPLDDKPAQPKNPATSKISAQTTHPPVPDAISTSPGKEAVLEASRGFVSRERNSDPAAILTPPENADQPTDSRQPPPSFPSPATPGGTGVATNEESMKYAVKENEIAGSAVQDLPLASQFVPAPAATGNVLPLQGAKTGQPLHIDFAQDNDSPTTWMVASMSPSGAASQTSTANAGTIATSPTTQIADVERLISREVSMVRHSGAEGLAVTLKVDSRTSLFLQLTNHNGQIEATARCEQGGAGGLAAHWSELQESLARQNVQLLPLQDNLKDQSKFTQDSAANQNGSQPQNQPQQRPQPAIPIEALSSDDATDATDATAKTKTLPAGKRGWEKWA